MNEPKVQDLDYITLDKPFAEQIALVHRHWSGKHRRVVSGINLVSLVWLTRLKSNRQVNPDGRGKGALQDCDIRNAGTQVHLKGYGFILVFRIDTPDGDTEYWATNDLLMTMDRRTRTARQIWTIETYHRDIKQFCGVERCMVRAERGQRNHIGCSLRVYLRLIWHELETGSTRFATKLAIIRPALRQFLSDPSAVLAGFPQAGMAHSRTTA
jgi:hypothetical protein